jgi:hypothetical protein
MESRTVFVSSENRDKTIYPYGNTYTLHLAESIKDVAEVELLHATIPNTIFNLSNGAGVIGFSNTASGGLGQDTSNLTTFSLASGFYGASDIASSITNAVGNTCGITVTYLSAEGKFLFARDTSYGPFVMFSNTSEMSSLLGLSVSNTGVIINSSNVAYTSSQDVPLYSDNQIYRTKEFIKSDTVINLAPNEGIFLDIEELRSMFNHDAKAITGNTTDGASMSRSFGVIPMDVSSGAVKTFNKASDYDMCVQYPRPIEKLTRLTINWVDRRGKPISFNGMEDNSFILRMNTRRRNIGS